MVYSIDSEINNNEIKMDKTKLIQDCTRIKLEIDTIIKEVNVDHPSWEFLCDSKDSLSHAILEMEYPHEIEINIQ